MSLSICTLLCRQSICCDFHCHHWPNQWTLKFSPGYILHNHSGSKGSSKPASQPEIPQKSSATQFLQTSRIQKPSETQKQNAKMNTEQILYWTGTSNTLLQATSRVCRNSTLGNSQCLTGKSPEQPGLTSSWYWTTGLLVAPSNPLSFNISNTFNFVCPRDRNTFPTTQIFLYTSQTTSKLMCNYTQ